jgi:site-specific recombinase XerD
MVYGTYPHRQSSVVEYKPFKTNGLERLYSKGFEGDTLQQLSLPVSLPEWTKEIQPFLQNQLSDHTRRAYETDLKQFFGYLQSKISLESLSALRPEHIILFRKFLEEGRISGKPMEKSTINRKLAVVKSFFNWLKVNGLVTDNPAGLVKGYPQTQESSLKGLSDEEVKKMLETPNFNSKSGSLHTAVLCSLFYLGLRKGELIGLKVGDLDEERGVSVVKVRGKGHRVRILPVAPKVKAAIENYLFVCRRDKADKEAPLFMPTKNPKNGNLAKSLNPNAVTYMVVRYARKVGILKKISPHSCRATCISHALDKKATHRSVQHMAGWSTPLMIQRYDKRREDLKNSAAYLIDYGEAVAAS